MSISREVLTFKSRPAEHFDVDATNADITMAAGTLYTDSITANSTNSEIVAPTDAWAGLSGMIENVVVKCRSATKTTVTVLFFNTAYVTNPGISGIQYLDHQTITCDTNPAVYSTWVVGAANGLTIPYWDKTNGKKFHIGVIAASTIALSTLGSFQLEWGWRGNLGVL